MVKSNSQLVNKKLATMCLNIATPVTPHTGHVNTSGHAVVNPLPPTPAYVKGPNPNWANTPHFQQHANSVAPPAQQPNGDPNAPMLANKQGQDQYPQQQDRGSWRCRLRGRGGQWRTYQCFGCGLFCHSNSHTQQIRDSMVHSNSHTQLIRDSMEHSNSHTQLIRDSMEHSNSLCTLSSNARGAHENPK